MDKQFDDYRIHLIKKSSGNEDLFDAVGKDSLLGPKSSPANPVKDKKDKKPLKMKMNY